MFSHCAPSFSQLTSGGKYPQLKEYKFCFVLAYSEYSSVSVDCWWSSFIFQMFLAVVLKGKEDILGRFFLSSLLFLVLE